ncbi:MAG: UDP-N-acetylmuramate--L-alanine ligase [Pseudomonadota bacterium]
MTPRQNSSTGTPETAVRLPFESGVIHFVGIGGIGMSGIAEVMHNLGYTVQGSDIAEGGAVKRLRGLGLDIAIGHDPENVARAEAVVISTAIRADNPELLAARARGIPVVRRADMLAELMRLKWTISVAGAHGKTTTTTMLAALFDEAGLDPTVINGGIINAYGANARIGEGDWMIVEADESDGAFLRLPTTVAVVTNIDPEHLDYWGDFDRLRRAFDAFIENTPFYGFGVVCLDHPEVQALVGRVTDRRLITYGANPQADVRAENVTFEGGEARFDIVFRERNGDGESETIARIDDTRLPMPGVHNVLNALAAAAVARRVGASDKAIKAGFANFAGVKRRFTIVGEASFPAQGAQYDKPKPRAGKAGKKKLQAVGGTVTVVDDYGHHPAEISAVLGAARNVSSGKIIAVVQPHRYTRLRELFDDFCACFNEADAVFVSDVYAAGEAPLDGFDKASLTAGIAEHGHRAVYALEEWAALPSAVADIAEPGDMVVCLGAGDITKYANALPGQLEIALRELKT